MGRLCECVELQRHELVDGVSDRCGSGGCGGGGCCRNRRLVDGYCVEVDGSPKLVAAGRIGDAVDTEYGVACTRCI